MDSEGTPASEKYGLGYTDRQFKPPRDSASTDPTLRSAIFSQEIPPSGQGAYGGPCRMTARAAIGERIRKLRREADNLEALLKSLPMELPHPADEALWEMTLRR